MKLFKNEPKRNTRAQRVAKLRAKVKKAKKIADLKAEEQSLRAKLSKLRG